MQTAIVATGKTGDILSAIAIAQSMGIEHLVTSRQYGGVAEGIPGITIHYLDSDWDDLGAAIREAKRNFPRVLIPQTFGKDFPIQHTTPSFQLDQWARCEKVGFQFPPLKLNPMVEIPREIPSDILFVGTSQSSPFEHAEELWDEIQKRYGDNKRVVRLDGLKSPDFKDFIRLYSVAKVLITVDTAHLHLARASSVPVIAFAADKPHKWRGSADSVRYSFYCRYSDYPQRKEELFHALDNVLQGKKGPSVLHWEHRHPHAYNPSHITTKDGRGFIAYRFHPDPLKWRTSLAIKDDKNVWPIAPPKGFETYSHEDIRLFEFNGKLHASYVLSEYGTPATPHSAVGYGELVFSGDHYRIENHTFPQYGKNNWTGVEKNWLFFEQGGKLFCSYQCAPEHIVLQISGDKVVNEWRTKCPPAFFGSPRGGTQPISHNGMLLRFFHSQSVSAPERAQWRYNLGMMLMESDPPFQIVKLSQHPILTGSEAPYCVGHRFYKPNIIFPAGVEVVDGGWNVSIGINDSFMAIAQITPEHLAL